MAYIGKQPGTGVRNRFLYTATAGQTTFTTSDSNLALSYSDALYMDVYLNGVLLDPANDYTATSGTSVVLGSGASAGDTLEIIVYDVFSVFNNTIDGNFEVGGDLTVDTNTLVVDSTNNRVGVGTSPAQPFHVKGGAVQFENTQNTYLQVNTTDTHLYTAAAHPLRLGTNSTERLRILSSGGLTFNGDTAAANALDDYERGSWTPVYQATTTNGSIGYNIQVGHYIKVGDLVTASFRLQTSSASGFVGSLLVGGLPYASKNTTNLFGNGIVGFSNNFVTVAPQVLHLGPNSTQASCITNEGIDAYSELRTAVNAGSHLSNTNGHNGLIGTIVYHTD